MLTLLLAGSIAASVPTAVDTTLATMGPLAQDFVDPEVAQLKRRVYKLELENEATRVLADAYGALFAAGSCDITSTGWAIANGAYEGNKLLGGSRNSALIIIGTKGVAFGVQFLIHRRQASKYVACMMQQYDGEGAACNQLRSIKRTVAVTSLTRVGLCASNIAVATKGDAQ